MPSRILVFHKIYWVEIQRAGPCQLSSGVDSAESIVYFLRLTLNTGQVCTHMLYFTHETVLFLKET